MSPATDASVLGIWRGGMPAIIIDVAGNTS